VTATIARIETVTAEIAETTYELVLRGLHIHAADQVVTITVADLGGFEIDYLTTHEEREEFAQTLEDNGYALTWTGGPSYGVHSLTGDTFGFLTHLQRTFTAGGYDLP